MNSPDIQSSAIRSILSMVDFNCFQMMMVTRNAELEMEQNGGGGDDDGGGYDQGAEAEDEVQLRRAIEMSMAEGGGEDAGGGEDEPAGGGGGRGRGRAGRGRGRGKRTGSLISVANGAV